MLDPAAARLMDHVRFDHQVLIDELRRVGIVRMNSVPTRAAATYTWSMRSLVKKSRTAP